MEQCFFFVSIKYLRKHFGSNKLFRGECFHDEIELRDRERVALAYCTECIPKDGMLYGMHAKRWHAVWNAC